VSEKHDPPFDSLMTESDVAQRLNLAIGTLQTWRSAGRGPSYVKLGRAVRYRQEDVARFVRDSLSSSARSGADA
jgi:predicted site-specific integrase-resolvase